MVAITQPTCALPRLLSTRPRPVVQALSKSPSSPSVGLCSQYSFAASSPPAVSLCGRPFFVCERTPVSQGHETRSLFVELALTPNAVRDRPSISPPPARERVLCMSAAEDTGVGSWLDPSVKKHALAARKLDNDWDVTTPAQVVRGLA